MAGDPPLAPQRPDDRHDPAARRRHEPAPSAVVRPRAPATGGADRSPARGDPAGRRHRARLRRPGRARPARRADRPRRLGPIWRAAHGRHDPGHPRRGRRHGGRGPGRRRLAGDRIDPRRHRRPRPALRDPASRRPDGRRVVAGPADGPLDPVVAVGREPPTPGAATTPAAGARLDPGVGGGTTPGGAGRRVAARPPRRATASAPRDVARRASAAAARDPVRMRP